MRILTVRQPWAWAIIHGGKDIENRPRNIAGDYRGPVAIHVATAMPMSADLWRVAEITGDRPRVTGFPISPEHPGGVRNAGHIIGVVDLRSVHDLSEEAHGADEDSRPSICSPWAEWSGGTAYHLVLRNPRPLAEPIPYRGALGLRRLFAETIAEIEAAIQ